MTNSRFEDLEKRAKKLIYKMYLKYALLFTLLGIVVFGSFVVYKSRTIPQVVAPIQIEKTITQEVVVKEKPATQKSEKTIVDNAYDTPTLSLSIPSSQILHVKEVEVAKDTIKEEKRETQVVDKVEDKSFVLEVKSTKKEEVLLRDFSSNKTFETAMELCEVYFAQASYAKAIFWAKEASRLKPESASPWIVYARAKEKLGQNQEAIKALENYLSFFSSKVAHELLVNLKGKSK